jgi:hypothetical protein
MQRCRVEERHFTLPLRRAHLYPIESVSRPGPWIPPAGRDRLQPVSMSEFLHEGAMQNPLYRLARNDEFIADHRVNDDGREET